MSTNDEALKELTHQFEQREAGVLELLDLYEQMEAVYIRASKASSEIPFAIESNATNGE